MRLLASSRPARGRRASAALRRAQRDRGLTDPVWRGSLYRLGPVTPTVSSCPGLTRASIVFARGFSRSGWIAGSSPAMTVEIAASAPPRADASNADDAGRAKRKPSLTRASPESDLARLSTTFAGLVSPALIARRGCCCVSPSERADRQEIGAGSTCFRSSSGSRNGIEKTPSFAKDTSRGIARIGPRTKRRSTRAAVSAGRVLNTGKG